MSERQTLTLDPVAGVEGDHGSSSRRQVTLLDEACWRAAVSQIGEPELAWTARRANVLVRGVLLESLIDSQARLGEIEIEVLGEVDPCFQMEDEAPGLERALRPECRGGVYARILTAGEVNIGDELYLTQSESRI